MFDSQQPPSFPYQFRLGLSLVNGLARPISVDVSTDPEWGEERQTWHHVLRVQIRHGPVARFIRWLGTRPYLPSLWRRCLAALFPGPFLPCNVVLKGRKPDWDDEFENEARMYRRLESLQGSVVPVFYGRAKTAAGEPALVLSDIGGRPLGSVSYGQYSFDELSSMLRTALEAIHALNISPTDANLVNCIVVGKRVMIVDHEQDEDITEEDLAEWSREDFVNSMVQSIMSRHRELHQPSPPMTPEAAKRANDEWIAKYGAAAMGRVGGIALQRPPA